MADTSAAQQLLTLGQIAKLLGISTHRLKYAIDQYRIDHTMRVGITRVWTDGDIPQIKSALARVALNRGVR